VRANSSLKRRFTSAAVWVSLALAGCTGPTAGEVRGKVTFKGQPVLSGQLSVVSADGRVESCSIDDGLYFLRRAPVGQAQVAITGATYVPQPDQDLKEKMMKRAREPKSDKPEPTTPENPGQVPAKYMNPQTSGLTLEVKAGQQVHDFDLPG
jgi:hypothetical protein